MFVRQENSNKLECFGSGLCTLPLTCIMHVYFEFLQPTEPNNRSYDKNFMSFVSRGKYQTFAD